MATDAPKAGKYELIADSYPEYDDKGQLVRTHQRGDVVSLTAEQAERLTEGPRPAFAEPGSIQQAEADRLQAEADAAKAAADEAKARAADAAKDAKDVKAS